MITNKNYKIDLTKLTVKKTMFDFAKELSSDERALGKENTRNKSFIRLLQSPVIISLLVSLEDPNEFCDRIKFFYYKRNKLEIVLTWVVKKLLQQLTIY